MEIEEQIKKDQQDRVVKMFEQVVSNAHPKLLYYNNELDEVCFYAPKICIDYLKDYYNRNITTPLEGTMTRYRGFKIKEHYLPEITLAHSNYALYLQKDMISTVSIG